MKENTIDRILIFTLFFMAYWFFGNLYEEIVLIPNQLVASFEALTAWQSYFKVTDPLYYYVPWAQLPVVTSLFVFFKSKDRMQRSLLKKACIFSMIAVGITIVMVNEINEKLFNSDLAKYKDQLQLLAVLWLIGNAVRLFLVWKAMRCVFQTIVYRKGKTMNF